MRFHADRFYSVIHAPIELLASPEHAVGNKGQVGDLHKSKTAMAMDRLQERPICFERTAEMPDTKRGETDHV